MRDSVMRAVGALLGGVVGYQIAVVAGEYWPSVAAAGFRPQALGVIVGGLAGLLALPPLSRAFVVAMAWVLRPLEGLSLHDLLLGGLGLGVGLTLALFVGYLLEGMPLIGPYVRLVAGLVLGYLGLHVALQRRDELAGILRRQGERAAGDRPPAHPKLLDTSVIIDGRIADICRAGFLEGPLLVPRSVLTELQRIADSADAVRRNRGRRGLDILGRLRRELDSVQVIEDVASVIAARRREPRAGSYTSYLFQEGIDKIAKKIGEESAEVIIAAKNADASALANEAADLLYHLLVLLAAAGVDRGQVWAVLRERRGRPQPDQDSVSS